MFRTNSGNTESQPAEAGRERKGAMEMELLQRILENRFSVTAVILFGVGFANLMLQHNLVKKVVGFNIMDSAVFLLLASQGYIQGHTAPIVAEGVANAAELYINPIPSGLVLTGIVVSVSVSAFSLALIQRIYHKYGTVDLRELVMRTEKEED